MMARLSQCPEVMNDDIKTALETLQDALNYLRTCPIENLDNAELYVERCRAAITALTEEE